MRAITPLHAVIYRNGTEQLTTEGWDLAFPQGYACGKCVEAEAGFEGALARTRRVPERLLLLRRLAAVKTQRDPVSARLLLDQALRERPAELAVLDDLQALLVARREPEEMEAYLRQALSVTSDSDGRRALLARLAEVGRASRAPALVAEALGALAALGGLEGVAAALELGLAQPLSSLGHGKRQRLVGHPGQHLGGTPVRLDFVGRPSGHEIGNQRSARHHLAAQRFDQPDDAVRHPVEVGHPAFREHLHRHRLAPHRRPECRVQLLPPGVGHDPARKASQRAQLDLVRHGLHGPFTRDPDEKAAGAHSADVEDPPCHWIQSAEVEQQPAIRACRIETAQQSRTVDLTYHQSYPSTAAARQ